MPAPESKTILQLTGNSVDDIRKFVTDASTRSKELIARLSSRIDALSREAKEKNFPEQLAVQPLLDARSEITAQMDHLITLKVALAERDRLNAIDAKKFSDYDISKLGKTIKATLRQPGAVGKALMEIHEERNELEAQINQFEMEAKKFTSMLTQYEAAYPKIKNVNFDAKKADDEKPQVEHLGSPRHKTSHILTALGSKGKPLKQAIAEKEKTPPAPKQSEISKPVVVESDAVKIATKEESLHVSFKPK